MKVDVVTFPFVEISVGVFAIEMLIEFLFK